MRIVGRGNYGDHHAESSWYDYDAEVIEPVPPTERNVGLKTKHKPHISLDFQALDTDIVDIVKSPLRTRRKSKQSSRSKISAGGESKTSFRAKTMVIFD